MDVCYDHSHTITEGFVSMISNNISKLFLFSLFCFFGFCCRAGSIAGNVINLSCGESMVNDDRMVAEKAINMTCGKSFKGVGYMEAPDITIMAEKFEYTGIINCGRKCNITVKEPFDAEMFKREGEGEFIITVDPLFKPELPKFEMPDFARFEKLAPRLKASEFKFGEKLSALSLAVCNNDLDTVVELLKSEQIAIDECGDEGRSALMFAANKGHLEIAKVFLEAGANADKKDSRGRKARDYALMNDQIKAAKLIKRYEPWITKKENVEFCFAVLFLGTWFGAAVLTSLVKNGWNPFVSPKV